MFYSIKYIKRLILNLTASLIFCNISHGQTISGTVSFDNYKGSTAGTSVYVKETLTGTIVDKNNYYQLEIDSLSKTLCFNYIGFEPVEIKIENKTTIDVNLVDEARELEALEVIANYRPPKRTLYATVNNDDMGKAETVIIHKGYNPEIVSIRKSWGNTDINTDWLKYIYEKTEYPDSAIVLGIQGNVYTRFVIDTAGKIGHIEILRGLDPMLDSSVISIVKTIPQWSPSDMERYGYKHGLKYAGVFILPVKYRIKEVSVK